MDYGSGSRVELSSPVIRDQDTVYPMSYGFHGVFPPHYSFDYQRERRLTATLVHLVEKWQTHFFIQRIKAQSSLLSI